MECGFPSSPTPQNVEDRHSATPVGRSRKLASRRFAGSADVCFGGGAEDGFATAVAFAVIRDLMLVAVDVGAELRQPDEAGTAITHHTSVEIATANPLRSRRRS